MPTESDPMKEIAELGGEDLGFNAPLTRKLDECRLPTSHEVPHDRLDRAS